MLYRNIGVNTRTYTMLKTEYVLLCIELFILSRYLHMASHAFSISWDFHLLLAVWYYHCLEYKYDFFR